MGGVTTGATPARSQVAGGATPAMSLTGGETPMLRDALSLNASDGGGILDENVGMQVRRRRRAGCEGGGVGVRGMPDGAQAAGNALYMYMGD